MYTPLEFVESRKSMLRVLNGSPALSQILNDAIKEDILTSTPRSIWFEQLGDMYSKFWKDEAAKFTARIGVELHDDDLVQYVADTLIADEWSKYKVVYKPARYLLEAWLHMKETTLPDKFLSDIPTMYIDLSESADVLQGAEGIWVIADETVDCLRMHVQILHRTSTGLAAVMLNMSCERTGVDSVQLVFPETKHEGLLDGELEINYNLSDALRIIYGTLMARYAKNCEVVLSERTKIAYRKPTGEPKNKIREVLEYTVNTVNTKKSGVRYKYIEDGTPKRTVCSHYRNPHYQIYWVKVNGERVPELKWVDGMYINGRESKNVNIKRLANDN